MSGQIRLNLDWKRLVEQSELRHEASLTRRGMVIADTSVWIPLFNRPESPERRELITSTGTVGPLPEEDIEKGMISREPFWPMESGTLYVRIEKVYWKCIPNARCPRCDAFPLKRALPPNEGPLVSFTDI